MKRKFFFSAGMILAGLLAFAPAAHAQRRPYIGYAYPAGGQVSTSVQLRVGGQDLDEVDRVLITGRGVTGRVIENYRRLNNQEVQLLREQLKELKRPAEAGATPAKVEATRALIAKIEQRLSEWVQTPACVSISGLVLLEITIAPDAEAGSREIRLASPRGVTNPLAFEVGQLLEYARKPMVTATIQVLGKEANALRQRPPGEAEDRVVLPCTVNGQIASGEVNRYRFTAFKGQRLVLSAAARQLIPFIADAVPGWFQPVLELYDAEGREVAFDDDYRFKPDPVILFEVPKDGEYVCAIHDSLFRGREDFVYRITIGDVPFVTSVFPLGEKIGARLPPRVDGVNTDASDVALPAGATQPGIVSLAANRLGFGSNRVPFALDALPDQSEREPNDDPATAQKIALPVIINGRIDRPDDWDLYQFTGHAKQQIVIDVQARRLDSPLDSVVKLVDGLGRLVAFNDDREDVSVGINTHAADSYIRATLPTDGVYTIYLGDIARGGGDAYGYRLRISEPQPDFELRVVPSSVSLAVNATTAVTVYAVRKDGFSGPIKLALKDATAGFSIVPVTLAANQNEVKVTLKSGASATKGPVRLNFTGIAKIGAGEITRDAVPAEDRMQAFLWRHLVPASDFEAVVFDRNYQRVAKRTPPPRATIASVIDAVTSKPAASAAGGPPKPKFTKQQIVGRLRELKLLYEESLITDEFYEVKVIECEGSQ